MLCYATRLDPGHAARRCLQLELAVKTQQADFVDVRVADALKLVSDLELLEVSHGSSSSVAVVVQEVVPVVVCMPHFFWHMMPMGG